ncbi:MAG: M48 family metallopeptidase [Chitinophagaceae bacterium]|nr:M48 family metallopeptidase [Chitinophagaceae bacterium]
MIRRIMAVFISTAFLIACAKNPITGRNQARLVSEQELQSMASQQYQQFLSTNKVVSSSVNRDAEMVKRVGQRVTRSVEEYLKTLGRTSDLEGYKWEYNLVEDPAANAWCMPGGKIVVYTGLLPITQNEAALAAVMGHEIAHAVLFHGNERVSQGMIQQGLGSALGVALSNQPAATQNVFMAAYGIGSQVGVLLPFSRKQELESDRFGMIWMAGAGYNPQEAINLWTRMQAASNGSKPPEFLSTHPSEGNRIAQLKKYLPEAMKNYKPVGK